MLRRLALPLSAFMAALAISLLITLVTSSSGVLNLALGNGAILLCFLGIRSIYRDERDFLFSSGFWLIATVAIYFVVKSIYLLVEEEPIAPLLPSIWAAAVFSLFFTFGLFFRRLPRNFSPSCDQEIKRSGLWIVFSVFVALKVFGLYLIGGAGEGNVLEMAEATQNQGAAYLYRIPSAANGLLILLLLTSYTRKIGWTYSIFCMMTVFAEAILTSNRFTLVIACLWIVFLYNRHVKRVRLYTLAAVAIPLVFVIVLFGYARNISVGSLDAYGEALAIIGDSPDLILKLFMGRLDLLPQVVSGLELYEKNIIQPNFGLSYIYSFLHAVPRNLWPDKPPLTAALLTSITHPSEFSDGVLLFPSVIFESILNFGWLGIPIIGMALGTLSGYYDRWLYGSSLLKSSLALLFISFPMGIFNEGFHSNYVANILYLGFIYLLLFYALKWTGIIRPVPRKEHPPENAHSVPHIS